MRNQLRVYITSTVGEEYSEWSSDFKIDNFKDRISELLVENVEVKKMHSKLVSLYIVCLFVCVYGTETVRYRLL